MKANLKIQITCILIAHLSQIPAWGEVNMKDGSYFKKFIDLPNSNGPQIARTYNSRSLFRGYFGKGWCSNLDRNIDSSNPERVLLVDCAVEKDIQYVKEFSTAQVRQGGTFSRTPQSETIFYANPETGEKLVFQDQQYVKHALDGTTLKFAKDGRLLQVVEANGAHIRLEYQKEFLRALFLSSSKWEIVFDSSQKLIRAFKQGSQTQQYAYERGLLTGVRSPNAQVTRYQYNDFENLTDISTETQILEKIRYQDTKDLVQSVQTQKGCFETYAFQAQIPTESDRYKSSLVRNCQGQISKFDYEFYHRYRSDGVKYLELMRILSQSAVTEIYYHPQMGFPVLVNTQSK